MKITVRVPIDVDPEAWVREYGVERADVREDVRQHVQNLVRDQLDALGLLMPEVSA